MRLNKKGFTLVELLAVIVILAVVMLIAVTAVGPLMTKSRKSALGTEGVSMVDAAKTAYQAEQLNSNSKIKPTSSVCFDLEWLYNKNYFDKGKGGGAASGDGYTGSVLVTYSGGRYTYKFWISNGVYIFGKNATNGGVDPTGYDVEDTNIVFDVDSANTGASKACGGVTGVVKCTGNNACA